MLIHVSTFELRDGVDRGEFLAADKEFQTTITSSQGFVRRTTAEGTRGWIVITLWADDDSRVRAGARLSGNAPDLVNRLNSFLGTVDERCYTDIGG